MYSWRSHRTPKMSVRSYYICVGNGQNVCKYSFNSCVGFEYEFAHHIRNFICVLQLLSDPTSNTFNVFSMSGIKLLTNESTVTTMHSSPINTSIKIHCIVPHIYRWSLAACMTSYQCFCGIVYCLKITAF